MRVSQGLDLRSDRNNLSAESRSTWSKDTQQETSRANSLTHSLTQAVSVMRMQEACHNSVPEFIVEVLMTAVGVRVASLLKEEHSLHAQVSRQTVQPVQLIAVYYYDCVQTS
jgi:hypothetical protein